MTYDPYRHAEDLGIEVIHRPIKTANGLWLPDHQTIVIKTGMRVVHDRSALAHEIGHAELGHRDARPKHEVLADRYAAEHMIDPDELVDLMKWSPDMSRWSTELGVSSRLIRVYWNTHRNALSA